MNEAVNVVFGDSFCNALGTFNMYVFEVKISALDERTI
jgi:hypothetical protein